MGARVRRGSGIDPEESTYRSRSTGRALVGVVGVVQVRALHGRDAGHHDGRRRDGARSSRRSTGRRRPPRARARASSSSERTGRSRAGRARGACARPLPYQATASTSSAVAASRVPAARRARRRAWTAFPVAASPPATAALDLGRGLLEEVGGRDDPRVARRDAPRADPARVRGDHRTGIRPVAALVAPPHANARTSRGRSRPHLVDRVVDRTREAKPAAPPTGSREYAGPAAHTAAPRRPAPGCPRPASPRASPQRISSARRTSSISTSSGAGRPDRRAQRLRGPRRAWRRSRSLMSRSHHRLDTSPTRPSTSTSPTRTRAAMRTCERPVHRRQDVVADLVGEHLDRVGLHVPLAHDGEVDVHFHVVQGVPGAGGHPGGTACRMGACMRVVRPHAASATGHVSRQGRSSGSLEVVRHVATRTTSTQYECGLLNEHAPPVTAGGGAPGDHRRCQASGRRPVQAALDDVGSTSTAYDGAPVHVAQQGPAVPSASMWQPRGRAAGRHARNGSATATAQPPETAVSAAPPPWAGPPRPPPRVDGVWRPARPRRGARRAARARRRQAAGSRAAAASPVPRQPTAPGRHVATSDRRPQARRPRQPPRPPRAGGRGARGRRRARRSARTRRAATTTTRATHARPTASGARPPARRTRSGVPAWPPIARGQVGCPPSAPPDSTPGVELAAVGQPAPPSAPRSTTAALTRSGSPLASGSRRSASSTYARLPLHEAAKRRRPGRAQRSRAAPPQPGEVAGVPLVEVLQGERVVVDGAVQLGRVLPAGEEPSMWARRRAPRPRSARRARRARPGPRRPGRRGRVLGVVVGARRSNRSRIQAMRSTRNACAPGSSKKGASRSG